MIHTLPTEIIDIISFSLSPSDALHLAITNKYMYTLIQPRLYHSIVIDANKYPYDHELIQKSFKTSIPSINQDCYPVHIKPTKIKSLYGLNLILKNLIENPHYCSYVYSLNFDKLIPDISEFDLFNALMKIFPKLTNLRMLNWLIIQLYLSLDLINLLPNISNMIELNGNFKNFNQDLLFFSNSFQNLKVLNVSGFNNIANLSKFDLNNFPNLDKLIISKNSSVNNEVISNNQNHLVNLYIISDLIEINDPLIDGPCDYIKTLFLGLKTKLNLKCLVLKDLILNSDDADHLINNVNLDLLEDLSINNCTEMLFDNSMSSPHARRNPPTKFFLNLLCPHLSNLKVLDISLINELYYNESIYNFLKLLPTNLIKLSIFLTFNNFENINLNILKLFQILGLKHYKTLNYINFNFNIINLSTNLNLNNVIKPLNFNYCIKSIEILAIFNKLEFLKLPINQSQIPNLLHLIKHLRGLNFLQINLLNCDLNDSFNANLSPSPNCLISQDYFNFPNATTHNYNFNNIQQFKNYCLDFKCYLDCVKYIKFEKNNQFFVFDCNSISNIALKHGLSDYFDHLVNSILPA